MPKGRTCIATRQVRPLNRFVSLTLQLRTPIVTSAIAPVTSRSLSPPETREAHRIKEASFIRPTHPLTRDASHEVVYVEARLDCIRQISKQDLRNRFMCPHVSLNSRYFGYLIKFGKCILHRIAYLISVCFCFGNISFALICNGFERRKSWRFLSHLVAS